MTKSKWDELQEQAFGRLLRLIRAGHRSIVATGPTGFGKTQISQMLIRHAVSRNLPWVFYTHRKLLFEQTHRRFQMEGLRHGCRASGYLDEQVLGESGQMAMIPTELHAVKLSKNRKPHRAKLVIVDEAHACANGFSEELIRWHLNDGAFVVGLSATPVGLGHLYDEMCVLALNSQLRDAGGIVEAITYAPDEVDLGEITLNGTTHKAVNRNNKGEFVQRDLGFRFQTNRVFGSVINHWHTYNPKHRHTLLFAPGVKESMWMCDRFNESGIKAASIDGENVYVDGVEERSNGRRREDVIRRFVAGEIKVICNRFVFREGIDIPCVYHGIFATSFGTEDGWVQAGGRILRALPDGTDHVIIQDHGGNWHRHHDLNIDRAWSLEDTSKSRLKEATELKSSGEGKQDKLCPRCQRTVFQPHWEQNGRACPYCQFKFEKTRREIVQVDGSLKRVSGDPVKVKVKRVIVEPQRAWDGMYFASKNTHSARPLNFNQLRGWFHKKYPRYYVNTDGTKTIVYDRQTGEDHVLRNVPAPTSEAWNCAVPTVGWNDLQKG